jgi:RNA polymerase sigma-70 factor (ECF subfamily)
MSTTDYEDCFREQYPRLVALGAAMAGNREVARELAQEAMLRAHARWDEVGTYDAPGAWLRRVMTNLVIDHLRSRRAEESAVVRLGARQPGATDGLDVPADWAALVAPLPARQRIIVTLFYGEDLSLEQIADLLDIRVGTVKSALGKARERLAGLLGGTGDDGGNE